MKLTRIYQGKIIKVERSNKVDKNDQETWSDLTNWQDILWKHHCLFQDAVNYYTLMLAALAYKINSKDDCSEIIKSWAEEVKRTWKSASKKSQSFEGPHNRICTILGLDPSKSKFEDCVKKILQNCKPDADIRAQALIKLLVESGQSGLNQVSSSRLPWLCSENLNAANSQEKRDQELKRNVAIKRIHEDINLKDAVETLDPYNFLTKYPQETITEKKFKKDIGKDFEKLCKKNPQLQRLKKEFEKHVDSYVKKHKDLLGRGRKTNQSFPCALILKVMPDEKIADCFKRATEAEYKKIVSNKNSNSKTTYATVDYFEKLRFENDNKNPFEYFTNLVVGKSKNEAAWFEFDKMAFIEAINSPHRFYEDTKKRREEAESIEEKIGAIESKGYKIKKDEAEDDDEESFINGFDGDLRIDLIRKLVTQNLGWLSDVEGTKEYSIDPGTIRGFREIKEKWLKKFKEKSEPTEEELRKIVAEEQAAHRYDFGSAPLFNELAKKEFWPIWRDKGKEDFHPEDPIKAWIEYNELKSEREDKKRSIKFTPAHPIHSPRYFDFPKTGASKVEHYKNSLTFSAEIAVEENGKYVRTKLKFIYSAPRLLRDHLRSYNELNLAEATWLQPMMEALGFGTGNAVKANFKNAKISLMAKCPDDFQIVFPIPVKIDELHKKLISNDWSGQFRRGGKDKLCNLIWPEDKKDGISTELWTNRIEKFSCLSVDLGLRNAAAVARIEVQNSKPKNGKYRYIGSCNGKDWYAKVIRTKLLSLPGEDQQIWRQKTKMDSDNLDIFAFREEIFGSKGRKATDDEIKEAKDILKKLDIKENSVMPDDWEKILSFPDQNHFLLIAIKRAQSVVARLHRWAYFLKEDTNKKNLAFEEIQSSEYDSLKNLMQDEKKLYDSIKSLIEQKQNILTSCIVALANRILPLRGRSWIWKNHPDKKAHPDKRDCFILVQEGNPIPNVKIRGQRGLSLSRIEQITELRKRLQSHNQILGRKIGEKAPAKRDDSIPDCCPDILEKLENLREQRVNQTAHMILAEALGLRLAEPKSSSKKEPYRHGSYEKINHKVAGPLKPVDFVVIEDLSRYRTEQGRSKRENSRLMKWCHQAIRDKLKDLMKVFFAPCVKIRNSEIPPLLETYAAYSSRFCSRSGVAGFRAIELAPGFEKRAPWFRMLKEESKIRNENEKHLTKLLNDLRKINPGNPKIPHTLLAPIAGGPLFIPASEKSSGKGVLQPKISQADINAAINIGLRAIASPTVFEIHHRLRSEMTSSGLCLKEKRISNNNSQIIILNEKVDGADKNKKPNFFADFGGIASWGKAVLQGFGPVPLALGKALWKTINDKQWEICENINQKRISNIKN